MKKIVLPKHVKLIIDILEQNGFEGYAVGGCVRDCILGREPKDWDITTNALPQQVKALFNRTIDTGIKHGTVTVMMNHIGYEVTTYRIDGEYEDGRHPKEVLFTPSLIEDLKRRDFTINAMAYNDRNGVVDEFGGINDLDAGIIRCVGNAHDRFSEDALRMMRAVRFAAELGFTIEDNTRKAIKELSGNLSLISAERIRVELEKLIVSNNPGMIRDAYELGITGIVFPEFDAMMNTPQNSPYHCLNVGEHTIAVMENIEKDKVLRLAALLHDIGKPKSHTTDSDGIDHFHGHEEIGADMARVILRRLRYDNKTTEAVVKLVKYHDYPLRADEVVIRKSMNRIGMDIYKSYLSLRDADLEGKSEYSREINKTLFEDIYKVYEEVMKQNPCVVTKDLAVNGRDLMEAGVKKGEKIGDIINTLLELVIENPSLNTKDKLIEKVKELA